MLRSARRSAGFALIVVLWFLVLLATIGIYMMANGRSETALAHNVLAAARAEALADAGVAQAAESQMLSDPARRWRLDGTPYRIALPGGDVTVRLIDESPKINPNMASDLQLSGLFQALGLDRDHADRLGAAIADWVQASDTPRPLGAKKAQYEAAGRSYGPPGQAVESLDELQLVLGMTPQLLAAALPYLTIYTNAAVPADQRVMGAVVLKAVKIAAFEQSHAGSAVPAGDNAAQPEAGETPPIVMTVEATARSADGGTYVRRAVISVATAAADDADNQKPFKVMDWRRGVLSN
jgi:general secretion pathway protein K